MSSEARATRSASISDWGHYVKRVTLALAALAVSALLATPALASKAADPSVKKAGQLMIGLSLPSPGFQTGTFRGTDVQNP